MVVWMQLRGHATWLHDLFHLQESCVSPHCVESWCICAVKNTIVKRINTLSAYLSMVSVIIILKQKQKTIRSCRAKKSPSAKKPIQKWIHLLRFPVASSKPLRIYYQWVFYSSFATLKPSFLSVFEFLVLLRSNISDKWIVKDWGRERDWYDIEWHWLKQSHFDKDGHNYVHTSSNTLGKL